VTDARGRALAGAVCLALALLTPVAAQRKDGKDEPRRPKLTLRAQPIISTSPSRVVLTAELVGGPDDNEEYYCPEVQWEWGDDTRSASSSDCEPYQAGKSEITRRFRVEHRFRAGSYRIVFSLRRHDQTIDTASTSIQVRPGLDDLAQ
jgi:hypothetical protein